MDLHKDETGLSTMSVDQVRRQSTTANCAKPCSLSAGDQLVELGTFQDVLDEEKMNVIISDSGQLRQISDGDALKEIGHWDINCSKDRDNTGGNIDLSSSKNNEIGKIQTTVSVKDPRWKSGCGRYMGILLTILSAMMFSINALIFKLLKAYHPFSIGTWMFVGTGAIALPFYLFQRYSRKTVISLGLWESRPVAGLGPRESQHPGEELDDNDKGENSLLHGKLCVILLARGFTGCSGMLFFFYSLKYLAIGDALVIACSSPIFVFLLAFLFLKESCGVIPVFTIIMALIGVVIITRPPLLTGKESFQSDDLVGAALAFASMLSIASTLILMRYLQNVHHSLINLIFGIWGSCQTLGLALTLQVLEVPEGLLDTLLALLTGLLFFIGQTSLALALQLEEAGPVSLVRTCEVVFAFFWQFIFLNVAPDAFSVTGAGLILLGIVTTIGRKWVGSLPSDHKTRIRFQFLLK